MADFLKTYKIKLTAWGPLFIGGGSTVHKKGFLANQKFVVMIDLGKFYEKVLRENRKASFEKFIQNPDDSRSLSDWCADENFGPGDAIEYWLDRPKLIETENKDDTFNEIDLFIKNGFGDPYIPGSSLKGLLRTLIIGHLFRNSNAAVREEILTDVNQAVDNLNHKPTHTANIEHKLLGKIAEGGNDQAKDIMRAIIVADSRPLQKEDLVICQKIDEHLDGKLNYLTAFRECLKPDTEVFFDVTINQNLLQGTGVDIDDNFLYDAIKLTYDVYKEYLNQFQKSQVRYLGQGPAVYLGGGAGFYSKTLYTSLFDYPEADAKAKILLSRFFKEPHHKESVVSPKVIKIARYNEKFYDMGRCKLEIEKT
jgi:CRISPR type III-A-associated RAMP protein Csm5